MFDSLFYSILYLIGSCPESPDPCAALGISMGVQTDSVMDRHFSIQASYSSSKSPNTIVECSYRRSNSSAARAARSTPVVPPCSPCCPNHPDVHPPPAGDRSRVSSWLMWSNELSLRFFRNVGPPYARSSSPSPLPRLRSSCANAVRSTSNMSCWLEIYLALSARGIDAISRGRRLPLADSSCARVSWL